MEVTRAYLERITAHDQTINAYITVTEDIALAAAEAADKRLNTDDHVTPLTGIPIALKDIFVTKDIPTTCASKILGGFTPPYEGTPSAKIRDAGAVVLGKLNMDEFAMGSSNETSAAGPVRNPWDTERIPGGSSGGSAAAVAADLCAGALGTDTGGSIRQPAALCGVVGMKPTYGRVSRYGVIAFASSLDQVGPLAKDVRDAALLMEAIAGHDPYDSTSIPQPVPAYSALLTGDIKDLRIGLPTEYFSGMEGGLDPQVKDAVSTAFGVFEDLGATVQEVSLPHTEYAVATYYIIAPAEASSNLSRYDGVRFAYRAEAEAEALGLREMYRRTRTEGFGGEVKRRIMLGTYVLSAGYYDAYYLKAQRVRTLIRQDFEEAFTKCDVLVTPTSPTPAFRLGERTDDPLAMYLSDIFTIPANLAGIPGISIPCGLTQAGLPIGLQLLGPVLAEETLLRAAYAYEQATDWHSRRPTLS